MIDDMRIPSDREKRLEALRADHRGEFDFALPQQWVDEIHQQTGFWPQGHFVWLYDKWARIFGRPFPIDAVGDEMLKQFPKVFMRWVPEELRERAYHV